MTSYPAPPLPGSGKRTGGAITFWIGAVILVVSTVIAVLTWSSSFQAVRGVMDGADSFTGDTTITLEAGDRRTIYQVAGAEEAACSVVGPDGAELTLTEGRQLRGEHEGSMYSAVATFTAQQDGEHEVRCEGGPTLVGAAFDVQGAIGGFLGFGLAVAGAFLGGMLVIVGAILWGVGRGQSRRAVGAT